MTWKEIRDRKEDSIRESTDNPMVKNPNPFDHNGKTYKSFSDYLNSDEHKEFLRIEEESIGQYTQMAKEYFESLDMDDRLLVFFHVTNVIFKNYFNDNGSYRGLLYDKFGFGPEAYSLGCDSGMFTLHNSISNPAEIEERFKALMNFLKLDLSKEDMKSVRNLFEYGFDNSKQLNSITSGQTAFQFEKDPE